MSQVVVLKVRMSCEACSGAVKNALTEMEGVESFDIDMKEQKVTVKGDVQPDAIFETVSKTGKKTEFWEEIESNPTPIVATEEVESEPAPTVSTVETEPKSAPTNTIV